MKNCTVFVHLLVMAVAFIEAHEADQIKLLTVDKCPEMPIIKSIKKERLLGVWYAYASTPLAFTKYQRQCSTYNVKDSPYFNTNILYTNYKTIIITYACNPKDGKFLRKLRVLTRTKTPSEKIVLEAMEFLKKINFPKGALNILGYEAFCFEWYQLKFETVRRPITYQAPFNVHGE